MQSKSTEDIVVESADVVSWRDLTVYRIYVRGGEWQMLDFLAETSVFLCETEIF